MRYLNSILCVLVFLVGLVGTALLINHRLPLPEILSITEKLHWLKKHGDQYDTLFIGSSRTNRHIRADLFDQYMAAAGHPTHSFNLGVNAMRPPEDNFILEAALSHRRKPLKYVIVESNQIRLDSETDPDATTERKAYWLDPKRYLVILRRLLEMTPNEVPAKSSRWGMILYDTRRFVNRELNLGRGLELVNAHFEKSQKSLKKKFSADWQGWENKRQQPIKASELKIFNARMADLAQTPSVPDYGHPQDQELMLQKRRLIEAHGARMIVYLPPLAYRQRFTPDPKTMGDVAVLNFWDPVLYPEFYDPKLLADSGHFNNVGAELFTRVFVQRFLELK